MSDPLDIANKINSMDLNSRNKSVIGIMYDKQPYEATIFGIDVTVCKGVFPSDLGLATTHLIELAAKYKAERALDMGCGLGIIALALKKMGVPEVWAVDYHTPAINCVKQNAERHKEFGAIHIVLSDLFENIPPNLKFDLMIFNQPYAPQNSTKRRFGNDGKGGREVIARFFEQAISHMGNATKILMPYSEIAGIEHSPEVVSRDFGLYARSVFEYRDEQYGGHTIYEFSKK